MVAWAVAPGIGSVAQSNDDVKDREGGCEQSARLIVYKGPPSAGSRPLPRRNAAAGRGGCLRRGSRKGESIRVESVAIFSGVSAMKKSASQLGFFVASNRSFSRLLLQIGWTHRPFLECELPPLFFSSIWSTTLPFR